MKPQSKSRLKPFYGETLLQIETGEGLDEKCA
jgi:hypothetical protein